MYRNEFYLRGVKERTSMTTTTTTTFYVAYKTCMLEGAREGKSVCVVCVCVCERESERESGGKR